MANTRAFPEGYNSTLETLVPGTKETLKLPLIDHWNPQNAEHVTNKLGNVADMKNTLGKFPKNFQTEDLDDMYANLRLLSDTFEPYIASRGFENYRGLFSKETIPLHENTLSKVFMKKTGMDDSPYTAAVTGLTGWNPTWNEVTIGGAAMEVSTSAWGRFYKRHRFTDDINRIRWFEEIAREFADNAARTLDNLAGIRLYEGANKIFVQEVAAFDPKNPGAARLTLGASANDVAAGLTFDALREAQWLMQNYYENYSTVDSATGAISHQNKRKAVIKGYNGGENYLCIMGRDGYHQLLNDPNFRETFVVNGGFYAQQIVTQTLGISSPVFGLTFQVTDNPITLTKAADPKISTDGQGTLEVAFVMGGNNGVRTAVELSLEGWTKMINVGYDEDKKVDPFGLLSFTGWIAVTDFHVIRNEAVYAIPYVKGNGYVVGGNVVDPLANVWNAGKGWNPGH